MTNSIDRTNQYDPNVGTVFKNVDFPEATYDTYVMAKSGRVKVTRTIDGTTNWRYINFYDGRWVSLAVGEVVSGAKGSATCGTLYIKYVRRD